MPFYFSRLVKLMYDFMKHPSIILFLSMFISRGIDFILKTLLSRMLGPEKFGIIQQIDTYLEICVVISVFGINTAILKYASEKSSELEIKKIVTCFIKLVVGVSLLITIILIFFLTITNFGLDENVTSLMKRLLIILPLLSICHPSHGILVHIFNALQDVRKMAILKICFYLLQFLLAIVLVKHFGHTGYVYSLILLTCIIFIVSINNIKKYFIKEYNLLEGIKGNKKVLSFIGYSAASNISSILLGNIDLLLVIYYFSNKEVGLYGVAILIMKGLWLFPLSIMQIELPKISYKYSNGFFKIQHYKELLIKMLKIMLPLIFILGMFSKQLLTLIFGMKYLEVVDVLVILLVATLFYSFTLVGGAVLIATNYPNVNLWLNIGRSITNFGLSFILVPFMGLSGIATGTLVTYVLFFLVQSTLCKKLI